MDIGFGVVGYHIDPNTFQIVACGMANKKIRAEKAGPIHQHENFRLLPYTHLDVRAIKIYNNLYLGKL
jgi:hypothetical protein